MPHAPIILGQVSSGNTVSGSMQPAHGVTGRSVPRPLLGMPRMQPQGMAPYNLASQAGMGGGMNPGGIPMQRGVSAHQQQQVSHDYVQLHCCVVRCQCLFLMHVQKFLQQLRRKDAGMGMGGYPPQQKPRRM